MRVELVILDDFRHLIDSETDKILAKVLIKETGVPFLVIGIEGKVEIMLEANSQLSHLFAVREELTRFRWELAEMKPIFLAASVNEADLGSAKTMPVLHSSLPG